MLSLFFYLPFTLVARALPIPGALLQSPRQDSFYNAPDNLSDLRNGEIYNSRQVVESIEFAIQLEEVYQVAYRTNDVYGNASHTIATVFKPLLPSEKPTLFSFQFWEDSAELDCSPSYSLAKGLGAPDGRTATNDAATAIQFALSKGWYVVAADHEGPESAFIEGYTQGQNGLDGIKAAINHLGLSSDTQTLLYGYSGGASATVWMANLQGSYAPDVNIVGAAHGGTPVDIGAVVRQIDNTDSLFSGFIVSALAGLLQGYPDKNETLWPHFYDSLKNDIYNVQQPGVCIVQEVLFYEHKTFHTQMDVDFWTYEPIKWILDHESLLKNVSNGIVSTPKFPRYIFHGESDEIIPIGPVNQYVDEQCAAGANIQYVPWKGVEHATLEALAMPDTFKFLLQAAEGKTPSLRCGTPNNEILTLGSKAVGDIIGPIIVDLVKALNGITTPLGRIDFNPDEPYSH